MLDVIKNLFGGSVNQELKAVINNGAYIVDVRSPSEYSSGSANKAVNIPLDIIQNQLQKFKGKKNIVVFCRSGMRSSQAKNILERNGFKNVMNGKTLQNVKSLIED